VDAHSCGVGAGARRWKLSGAEIRCSGAGEANAVTGRTAQVASPRRIALRHEAVGKPVHGSGSAGSRVGGNHISPLEWWIEPKGRSPGDKRSEPLRPLRAERRLLSGCSESPDVPHSRSTAHRHQAPGCIGHPAFRAPSDGRRAEGMGKTRTRKRRGKVRGCLICRGSGAAAQRGGTSGA
jgi:hypothetical protein